MDLATLTTVLISAYHAQGKGNDRQDAVIDTVTSEVGPIFAALFKESGEDGIIAALNSFILEIYHYSPDAGQFFVRLMVNALAEKNQHRWPVWISMPIIIFLKAYFGALEQATKGRNKPTLEDVQRATRRLAAEAEKAADGFGKQLLDAREAARGINIPNLPQAPKLADLINTLKSLGGNMIDHTPSGDKKKKFEIPKAIAAGLAGGKEKVEGFFNGLEEAADTIEDYAQIVSNAGFALSWLVIITVMALFIGAGFEGLHIVIPALSAIWMLGPLAAYTRWRHKERKKIKARLEANPSNNPNEKPGNGLIEGGGVGAANAITWGLSLIVVAALCAFGAWADFLWAYVWTGLMAIGLAFFVWIFTDLVVDGFRALVHSVKDDDNDPLLWARLTRSFSLLGIIYCFVMIYPVFNGLMNHTQYNGWDVGIPALLLALLAGLVNTRVNSTPSIPPVEHIKGRWTKLGLADFSTARKLLFLAMVPSLILLTINAVFPPTPVKVTEMVDEQSVETETLPSYGKRIQVAVEEARPPECTDEVRYFVRGLEDETCQDILKGSGKLELVVLCEEAVECGALREDGSKKGMGVAKAASPVARAGMPEVGGGGLLCSLVAAIFLILVVVGLVKGEEKKKETGSAAHH